MKNFRKLVFMFFIVLCCVFISSCRIFPVDFGAGKSVVYKIIVVALRVLAAVMFFNLINLEYFSFKFDSLREYLIRGYLIKEKFPSYLVLAAAVYEFFHSTYDNFTAVYLFQMIMFVVFCHGTGICKGGVVLPGRIIGTLASALLIFIPMRWFLNPLGTEDTASILLRNYLNFGMPKISGTLLGFKNLNLNSKSAGLISFFVLLALLWIATTVVFSSLNKLVTRIVNKIREERNRKYNSKRIVTLQHDGTATRYCVNFGLTDKQLNRKWHVWHCKYCGLDVKAKGYPIVSRPCLSKNSKDSRIENFYYGQYDDDFISYFDYLEIVEKKKAEAAQCDHYFDLTPFKKLS